MKAKRKPKFQLLKLHLWEVKTIKKKQKHEMYWTNFSKYEPNYIQQNFDRKQINLCLSFRASWINIKKNCYWSNGSRNRWRNLQWRLGEWDLKGSTSDPSPWLMMMLVVTVIKQSAFRKVRLSVNYLVRLTHVTYRQVNLDLTAFNTSLLLPMREKCRALFAAAVIP
jgi:hypothetical protein